MHTGTVTDQQDAWIASEQEIGYLKIIFGILLVGTMSLAGWLFTTPEAWYMRAGAAVVVTGLCGIFFPVHRDIMRLIDEIRRL